jgi:outer membrane protein OmpA-like peptidoglycan-associated protein
MALSAISLGGCATKDFVREQVAAEDTKVQSAQTQIGQHETRLGQLDQATKDALDRATAAGKLAEGKFLYSMVLSDDSVKFKNDSSKLSPEAQQRLTDFADKLKNDNRNVYLEIQGHTDKSGTYEHNMELSQRRALAVKAALISEGVSPDRLVTKGYAYDKPASADPAARENRRVVALRLQ